MIKLHIRVLAGMDVGHDLAPEQAAFHDVGLFRAGDAVVAAAGQLEGDSGDALDLAGRVDLGVKAPALAVWQGLDPARLTKIDAAAKLAHDHNIKARDHLMLQGRGIGQGVKTDGRPKVREHIHRLAKAQEARFRPHIAPNACPLRTADRAHQHRIGRQRYRLGLSGQRGAV